MSTTDTTTIAKQPERIPIAKYHLIVLVFFAVALLSNYAFFFKFIDFVPEDLRGILNAIIFIMSFTQSGFLVAVIPLGMVFIFGWLYLMDVQVDIRKLYQIAVLSSVPIIVLLFGALLYVLFVLKIDAAMAQQLKDLSAVMLQEIKVNPASASSAEEWTALVKGHRAGYTAVMEYLFPGVVGLSCLLCGYFLHKRLNLVVWKAILIPITFGVSVAFFRMISSAGTGPLKDKLEEMLQR
jgi:hypothetical protein